MPSLITLPLGEIADEITVGYVGPMAQEYVDEGVPFLRSLNVRPFKFDPAGIKFISREFHRKIQKSALKPGDVVVVRTGNPGVSCVIPESLSDANCSDLVVIRPGSNLDPNFLCYYINSITLSHIKGQLVGAIQQHFNIGAAKEIRFPCVSRKDQQRIAAVLTALDAKIELNNRINEELEGMAKLLYDSWFVQFDFHITAAHSAAMGKPHLKGKPYRASGGKMIYNETLKRDIPEGWNSGNLEKLGTIAGGSTPSTEMPEYFCKIGTPWITPKDLSDSAGNRFIDRGSMDVTSEGIKAASLKLLPAGTVLLSSRAPIGYLAVARNPVTTNQGFKSFVPGKGFSTDYIYFTLKHFMKLIKANASGSTFKEISGGTLKAVQIYLPPGELVTKFTEHASRLSSQQSLLEQQNQQLIDLRDWLLPMLMNGQVTVS